MCFAAQNIFDSGWLVTFPVGAGDEEGATVVSIGAGADVGEVVGVEVDHLAGVVAVGFDGRHGDDEWLGAEIHPEIGVGRVGVGGDDELVVGRSYGFGVGEGVEGCAVICTRGIDGLLVHGLVVGGHGEAVDESVFGDGAGFGDGERFRKAYSFLTFSGDGLLRREPGFGRGRLSGALDGGGFPFAAQQFGLRPVVAKGQHERALWRGKPVGLLVSAGRIGLDVERKAAVAVELKLRQHGRVDEIALDGVLQAAGWEGHTS